jgi:hypothetical protein
MDTVDFFSGFGDRMAASGRVPLLLLLLAFVITFSLTRLYTRLARIKGWGSGSFGGGIHVHHMVVGILMILVSGLLEIALRPGGYGQDLLAIAFGIGAALTLDEFALWLYLRDVYWSEQGRSSIDASVVGVLLAALLLVGTSPFGLDGAREPSAVVFATIAFNTLVALVAFLKGKLVLGLLGVFVPVVGVVAAVRLAKPGSLWAKTALPTGREQARACTRSFRPGRHAWQTPSQAVRRPRRRRPDPPDAGADADRRGLPRRIRAVRPRRPGSGSSLIPRTRRVRSCVDERNR